MFDRVLRILEYSKKILIIKSRIFEFIRANRVQYSFFFLFEHRAPGSIAQERSRSRPNLRAPLKFHEKTERADKRENKGR